MNLCDTCIHEFAICDGDPIFGCDLGGPENDDTVGKCFMYKEDKNARNVKHK
jgi:hypothetical protein